MRTLLSITTLLGTLALASCQSGNLPKDGARRDVIAIEFGSKVTNEELAKRIEKAVQSCWVNKDPALAGLKVKSLTDYPDAREFAYQLALRDPLNSERYANINVFPASREAKTGYLVQIVQKGDGVDVTSVLRRAIVDIEWARPAC